MKPERPNRVSRVCCSIVGKPPVGASADQPLPLAPGLILQGRQSGERCWRWGRGEEC